MPFRVTDSLMSARLIEQLATARQRQAKAQEQIASGKRINRPSDDPVGAEKVMNIRVSQAALEQFKKTVTQADEKLRVGDNALESYEQLLDRAGALLAQGLSDFTTQDARQSLAVEIDGLRERALSIAQLGQAPLLARPPRLERGQLEPQAVRHALPIVEDAL